MGLRKRVDAGQSLAPKLQRTRNYSQFSFARENRPVDVLNLKPQHRKLRESLQRYGFLPSFPLMVSCTNGKFIIKDGQHRFTFAREFGLEVYFVVDDTDVSISDINQAQVGWSPRDHAMSWANQGHEDYRKAIQFADEWTLPIGTAFSMLAGTIVFKNVQDRFHEGRFKIRALDTATRVAQCFSELCKLRKGIRHQNLLTAIWACCHVEYFDENRIIQTVQRRPDQLYNAGTRDQFLALLEDLYNFNRKTREPLKFDADQAMKNRNPAAQS